MDEHVQQALATINPDTLSTWTDEKKNEFVETFETRSKVTRFILILCAKAICDGAERRQYVGRKQLGEMAVQLQRVSTQALYDQTDGFYCRTVGGRAVDELGTIAQERADAILSELPPLKKAVQVINPDVAKKIDARAAVIAKLKALKEQLEELGGELRLSELDQNMTIGQFRQAVKLRNQKRHQLCVKLKDLAEEGEELDSAINKALYKGLPGLSDAVAKVCTQHVERALALDATTRRVAEKVKFGDSAAAVELLRGFEKDEAEVSTEIKAEFSQALKTLQLAGKSKKSRKS